jgi:hypothetical protein
LALGSDEEVFYWLAHNNARFKRYFIIK